VNETCCVRPQLAYLLDDVALSGPDALYTTKKAQVTTPIPSGELSERSKPCVPCTVLHQTHAISPCSWEAIPYIAFRHTLVWTQMR